MDVPSLPGLPGTSILVAIKSNTHYTLSVFLPSLSSTQSACALLYSHLWPVCLYHIFPYLTKALFLQKIIEIRICFDPLYNIRLKHFSFYEEVSKVKCT
jgi:hypothetical protein